MSYDRAERDGHCLRWSRIDPELPPGLHRPKRDGDVGWDLEAMKSMQIKPGEAVDVPVNARIEVPSRMWAEIRARSSIARRGLQVDAGTIDTGYRGPLYVLVRNMLPAIHAQTVNAGITRYPDQTETTFTDLTRENTIWIQEGERIGQLVFYHVAHVWDVEVREIRTDTQRGEAGFGSTGR